MKRKIGFIASLIVLSVSAISVLHYTSDSASSTIHEFYKLLYFIPIILAAFRFGFRGGTLTALLIGFIYSPHRLLSLGFRTEAINELLDIFLFFAVGIITGILVEKKNLAIATIDNQLKRYVILENYSNSIFESIRNGIVSINNDFLITSINSGAIKILEASEESIGVNIIEILDNDESMEAVMAAALTDGAPRENVEKNLLRNNKEVTIKIDIYPLSLDNRNKGLVIIIEDITEIKKIKEQMQRNDRLALVGELAAGIAHEIRNPLAIIKMIEQTMISELKDNREALVELQVIDEEVERANKVIKSLMEFGKPSKNEKGIYSINDIIDDVILIINKYTSQNNIKVNFTKGVIPKGAFDKEQLKQVFVNLVFNAVDAMPGGGEINISTEYDENRWIRVIFQDNGEGIEEKNVDKIFDPFFTTKDEGTGLGLPIVHRIIEEHDGVIRVVSAVGKGTKLEMLFPAHTEEVVRLEGFNSR